MESCYKRFKFSKWNDYEIKDLYVRLTGYNDGMNTISIVVDLGKSAVSVVFKGIGYLLLK